MATKCAYCHSETNKLTREHIWPACIIERVPGYTARYSERADKVFDGDMTIADVCAVCNNGPLSHLDSYICRLYDRWFVQFPERGQWLDFEYDWTLLGRWLLKICFNSARTSGCDDNTLEKFTDVILGVNPSPPDLAIWLDLVEPTYVEKKRNSGLIEAKCILPEMTRVCRLHIPNTKTPNYIVRLVAINAFYFYLAIPQIPYSGVYEDLKCIAEFFSRMACLDPDDSKIRAETTGLSSQLMIRPHLIQKHDLYDAHFGRRKKKT